MSKTACLLRPKLSSLGRPNAERPKAVLDYSSAW